MLRSIAAICLIIAGLAIAMFFTYYRYKGLLFPHPSLFWIAGIVLFLIGSWLLRSANSRNETKAHAYLDQLIADFKTTGEKVTVDLTNCEILSNDYIEKKEDQEAWPCTYHFDKLALMYLLDRSSVQTEINVQQSVFICPVDNPRTGKMERFLSPVIPKDKVSLSFYLESQKQTTLYIDKADRSRYYFDLDFLFQT